jgi:hypothetical protein
MFVALFSFLLGVNVAVIADGHATKLNYFGAGACVVNLVGKALLSRPARRGRQ